MTTIDEWNWLDDEGTPMAAKVSRALEPLGPAVVECYCDEGLPWVQVCYDNPQIVPPEKVVPVGEAIHGATGKAVLFQALRPNSIYYVIDDDALRKPGEPRSRATEFGVALNDLSNAWGVRHRSKP